MPYDKEMYKQLNIFEKLILKIIDRCVQVIFDKIQTAQQEDLKAKLKPIMQEFDSLVYKKGSVEEVLSIRD